MNIEEFSNEFDTLLNSHAFIAENGFVSSNKTIDLDEYEKSIFLTQAQDELILSLYNGKNEFRDSFESTEELRRYLSSLIKTYHTNDKLREAFEDEMLIGLDEINSCFYRLPKDLWFITFESVKFNDGRLGRLNGKTVKTIPARQDELSYLLNNSFRRPDENKVIRLDIEGNIVEIISKYDIDTYTCRYISSPKPIILTELPQPLSIKGEFKISNCKVHESLHLPILKRAVILAYTRTGNVQQQNS